MAGAWLDWARRALGWGASAPSADAGFTDSYRRSLGWWASGGATPFPVVPAVAGWRAVRVVVRWRAKQVSTRWRAGVSELVDNVLRKQAGDLLWRFPMDLADLPQLYAGATVTGGLNVAASPSGLSITGAQIESGGKAVSALFSGGTSGVSYSVTFTCVLSTGETVERTGVLKVV